MPFEKTTWVVYNHKLNLFIKSIAGIRNNGCTSDVFEAKRHNSAKSAEVLKKWLHANWGDFGGEAAEDWDVCLLKDTADFI